MIPGIGTTSKRVRKFVALENTYTELVERETIQAAFVKSGFAKDHFV